jgi:hypothetical protein
MVVANWRDSGRAVSAAANGLSEGAFWPIPRRVRLVRPPAVPAIRPRQTDQRSR